MINAWCQVLVEGRGKHAGRAGVVQSVDEASGRARVLLDGDREPVSVAVSDLRVLGV
jgi:hypothetical protein